MSRVKAKVSEARESLAATVNALGDEEVLVVLYLAGRLLAGQRQYGKLQLKRDKRSWKKELNEEVADMLMYSAFATLKSSL